MVDPLAEVVSLLQPGAPFSKVVVASAPWAVLEGSCLLTIDGPSHSDTITLRAGDFALIPAARSFATSSLDRLPPRAGEDVTTPVAAMPGGAR